MTNPNPNLVEQFFHADELVFEKALNRLASRPSTAVGESTTLFAEILAALSNAQAIGAVERERRASLVLKKAPDDRGYLQSLAQAAADWSPEIKNAVVRILPPELKALVYGRPHNTTEPPLITLQEPAAGALTAAVAAKDLDDHCPEVLLLGTGQEQDVNLKSLERAGFRPRRASSLEEYRNLLTPDVAGIVVGRNWWALFEPSEHHAFVESLLSHSSLTWLKISVQGCEIAEDLGNLSRAARYRDPTIQEMSLSDAPTINPFELQSLRQASQFISNPTSIRLCPADIDASQTQILIAAVAQQVQSRHYPAIMRLQEIATSTLQGGLSQAMILRAEPDDDGLPLVAKLAKVDILRDEMRRFQQFIAPWDNVLQPRFHYHGGVGVIIFGLVATPDQPLHPAPTLEDTLRKVMGGECGAPATGLPVENDLLAVIQRTITKTKSLNARPCADTTVRSYAWIDVSPLDTMLGQGIQWNLPALPSGRCPLDLRQDAVQMVADAAAVATIHGDMNLRNVLVRDGRDPFLIDYAYSGPGHPCFDLVRFESALMFQMFRMTDEESRVYELILALNRENTTLESIAHDFPSLCASVGNRLAIQAAIGARTACMDLLQQHQLLPRHYHAMKLVIACQSLTMPHLQTGIVRAAIAASAQLLEDAVKN